MSHTEKINNQFEELLNNEGKKIYTKREDLKKIFKSLYGINYITNRIELRSIFKENNDYFNVAFSNILEAYYLEIKGYSKASLLTLRVALENMIKSIIYIMENGDSSSINSRVYNENKVTLDKLILGINNIFWQNQMKSLNGKCESQYGRLSGVSHALLDIHKTQAISFFKEIEMKNRAFSEKAIAELDELSANMFQICIILSRNSFKHWDSIELNNILRIKFGKRKARSYLKALKE